MKLSVEILKIIGLSIVIGFLVLFVTKSDHFTCSALDAFDNESTLELFFDFIKRMLFAFGIWLVGLVTYFVIKKKRQISLTFYFLLLTVISLQSFIVTAATREPEKNRVLKQEVCDKSTDDGVLLTFLNLNKKEYDFINSKLKWLPSLPIESDIINIEYYRDVFLGDYNLQIELKLKSEEKLDTITYPSWVFDGTTYHYEKFEI